MTNYDPKAIEKDEVLERLMEEKRYKDAYQHCIELIAQKEHVSYAKLTMRSLIDKIDEKERRMDKLRQTIPMLLWIPLFILVMICKTKFHLNDVITAILTIVVFFIPIVVGSQWVRMGFDYIGGHVFRYKPGICLEYTPQITIEKLCALLKESLPGCTLQIQKNLIKVTSAQNDVDGQILLNQKETRRFTTIVVNVRMKEWYRLDSSVGNTFLANLLNILKDGIPNMIDGFSEPMDQPKPKKTFGIVLAVVAAAVIAAAVLFFSKPHSNRPQNPTGISNGHEWVDLGLPSGTLWATCNVGAISPEDYGNYYAWGETSTKKIYGWNTYSYGTFNTFSQRAYLKKYCNKPNFGKNSFTDNLSTLQDSDDPASSWGSGWHTPSKDQLDELLNNTTNKWTTRNGVQGCLFTARHGQTLFLPAAGYYDEGNLDEAGNCGYYWSSSLDTDDPRGAWHLKIYSNNCRIWSLGRRYGFSVRPVCSSIN